MKKCLSIILTLTMVLTMLSVSVYATGAESEASIITPASGQVISDSELNVTGTLPADCSSAKLLIDEAEVTALSVSDVEFEATVDISSYGYGIHKITLDADGKQIDRYVTFTGAAATVVRGTNFTGGSGATSSNMGGWGCSFSSNLTVNSDSGFRIYTVSGDNGTIGRTYAKKADGYVRVTMNNNRSAETINSGVFKLDADFSLTGEKVALQLAVRDRGGNGGYYLLDNLVGLNKEGTKNIFTDESDFETGKTYHLTVLIDIDRKTRTYIVDDKVMVNDQKLTRSDVLSCVDHFYFELTTQSSADATMTITNLNLTTIERYPFITELGGKVYDENASVRFTDGSVNLTLANAVDSSSVNAQNVVLKENGSAVDASVKSADGKAITITPANGFTEGASYTVEMSKLTYAFSENNTSYTSTYPKTLAVQFDAVSEFCIVSPDADYVFDGTDGKLEVMVPADYSDIRVLIDGKEINMTSENGIIFSSKIAYADFNLGNHLIEVTAVNDGEIQKLLQWFKVADFVSDVKEEYPVLNTNTWSPTVVSLCEGSDNSANGGYRITASNANAYYYVNNTEPKLSLTGTVVFEADIKRDASSNVYMIARNASVSNGSLVTDRSFIAAADGALVGTSIKVPAGEWHNYRIVTNLATKEYKLYYDNKLVAEGTNSIAAGTANAIPDSLGFVQLQVWCPTTDQGISVDNVKLYAYELNSDASVVSQAKGDEAADIKANTISAMADKVVVDLGAFDAIDTENVTVTAAGKAVEIKDAAYDSDAKALTLTLSALEADSVLDITIDKASQNSKLLAKPYSVIAKINCDMIGDITVDGESATVALGKGSDSSYGIDSAKFVIASYSGNKLVGVTFKDADIQADKITVNTIEYDGEAGGTEYKAFLWSGFDSLKPIAK